MKRIILAALVGVLVSGPAWAECRIVEKYNKKAKHTFQEKVGDRHCVVKDWMASDKMVLGYWLEGSTLNIVVQNIRNFKDIDLAFYGFTDSAAKSIAKKVDEAKQVRFVKMYNRLGIPNLEIKQKMEHMR